MLLSKIFNGAMFAATKYTIQKGRYLVPVAPKRAISSYILFSNDVRPQLLKQVPEDQKVSITEISKKIAEKWKAITPEEKQKYEKKTAELKQKHELEKAAYNAAYVQPFKKVSYQNLIMKEVFANNPGISLMEGQQAVKKFKQSLTEDQLALYKKKADEINASNEKIAQKYEIPTVKYPNFNSFLRAQRVKNPNLPMKSEMEEKQLAKLQKQFQKYRELQKARFKAFARSFHIDVKELAKMINKTKTEEEKLDEEGILIKQKIAKEKAEHELELKKAKQRLRLERQALILKKDKQIERQLKKLNKTVEKVQKRKDRFEVTSEGKLEEVKRKKMETQIKSKSAKDLLKKKEQEKKQQEALKTQPPATPVDAQVPSQAVNPAPSSQAAQASQPNQTQAQSQ